MLKRLKLNAELKQRKADLSALTETKSGFEKRQAELEASLEEAKTDDEIKLVQDNITELEKEVTDAGIEDKEKNLNSEITRIEGELSDLDKKEPTPPPAPIPADPTPTQTENRGGIIAMKTRGILRSLSAEQRSAIIAQDDVKSFLTRCREFKEQKRSVTGADLTIPDVFLSLMKDNLNKYSKLVSKIMLKPVGGKARQNIMGTIPEAIWTEMVGALNEMSISFNQIEVDGYMVGGYIVIPNSTLDDSDENLAAEILEALSQGIGLALDKGILYGTGKKMPTGIATRLAQTAQPDGWGANAPTWTDLHTSNLLKWDGTTESGETFFANLITKLGVCKANYSDGSMFWAMNTKTKNAIMAKAIKFNAAAALTASVNNTMPIIGGDIVTLDFIADNDIIGGYGTLYLLAERQGSSFASSDIPFFLSNQTVFKGSARYDGIPVIGEGFVVVNFANTNPTTTTTFAGDSANTDRVSLSALTIGSTPVTLYPPFDKDVLNYSCKVTAHANKITATALQTSATVAIKNGSSSVNSGSNATFSAGENTLTVEVTNGNATKRTYTVIVDDQTT